MATFEGVFSGRPITLRLVVTQGESNIEGNWSWMTWSLYAVKTGSTTAWTSTPANWLVNINGAVWTGNWTYDFNGGIGQTILLGQVSATYNHNADGTLTLTTYAGAEDPGGFLGTANTGSNNFTLTPIPRATTAVWADQTTNAIAGVAKTLNLPRASSSFTHNVSYSFGNSGWQTVGTGLGTSVNVTFPLSLLSQIPNNTTGTGTFSVDTYNSGTYVGTRLSEFTLEAPASVVPTFTTITHSEAVSGLAANVGKYVQGISRLNLALTAPVGAQGSTVTAHKIEVAGQTINAVSGATPAPITVAGASVPIVGTVTDSRGRSSSKTVNVEVLPYAPPVLNSVSVQRALSNGTPNDDGTYFRVNVNASVQSLMNSTQRNTMFIKTYTRARGTTPWTLKETYTVPSSAVTYNSFRTIGTYSVLSSFDVLVEVSDEFSTSAAQFTVSTAAIFQHWDSNLGVGIGKYRTNGTLDVAGDIYQNGNKVLDTSYTPPTPAQATESARGTLEIATTAEVIALTDDTRAVTPAKLRAGVKAVGGLVPRIPTTVGVTGSASIGPTGKVTFSSSSGVRMNGVFNNTARHYVVRVSVTNISAADWVYIRLSNGGTSTTGSSYHYQTTYSQSGAISVLDNISAAQFVRVGHVFTGSTSASSHIINFDGPASNLGGVGLMYDTLYGSGSNVTWVHGGGMWSGLGNYDGFVFYSGTNATITGEIEVLAYE